MPEFSRREFLQGSARGALAAGLGAPRPGVAVGKGGLNWRRIFAAARTGGLKNQCVEQSWELAVESVASLKSFEV